jgi:selenophosphate synthetase-related protein
MALLAIQTEHPELAALGTADWQVTDMGLLFASVRTEDGDTAAAAYEAVLGGQFEREIPYEWDTPRAVRFLDVVWRDVRVQIRISAPATVALAVAA